jgi:cytochrome d ubiquinol oxidase subunit II
LWILGAVLFGAALGNLVGGVPLNADVWFALLRFRSFSPTSELGVLDWYTVLAGLMALVGLAHHGALFLTWKTDGPVLHASRGWPARISRPSSCKPCFPVPWRGWPRRWRSPVSS